jgi:CHAD domain-containing protein
LTVERELKFEAAGDAALPDLTALAKGCQVVALPTERLEAVYYDTADLRLARWGATLRHRNDEWTVKLAASGDAPSLRVRHELSFDDQAAAEGVVFGLSRGAALAPVARLVTRRVRFRIVSADGAPLGELDDDEVVVYEGKKAVDRFREIEFELAEGDGDIAHDNTVAKRAARLLRKAGATPSPSGSKLLRVLGPVEPEVAAPRIKRASTVADAVAAALAAGTQRLIANDPGVRLDIDIEAVHQARVATRRLRSDLRTFAAFVDPVWAAAVRAELSWLGGALGAVRDADVLGLRLESLIARLPEADRPAAAKLLARLHAERDEARTLLLHEMTTERYAALLDSLVAASLDPPLAEGADVSQKGADVLRDLVADRWKKVNTARKRAVDDDGLHQVRIAVKRARYAAEAGDAMLGPKGAGLAKALAGVQGALGDLQDSVVAEEWLRGAVLPRSSTAMALAAGQLLVLDRALGDEARARWPGSWEKAASAFKAFAGSQ